jgi:HSP20 family protein
MTAIAKRENGRQPAQAEMARDNPVYIPRFDIWENDDELVLCGDMPGVTQETLDINFENGELTIHARAEPPGFEAGDFDVDVRGNYLTIRAEHKNEKKEGENGSRYSYGKFERSATLPPGVDAENVSARYRNGVLELQLPKSAESRGKRNTVQAS